MGHNSTRDFKGLAETLARLVIENKIVFNQYKENFRSSFIDHVKAESLKGMYWCLELFHQLEFHQESKIRLNDCNVYCIECYYFFARDENFYSTKGLKITPKLKKIIFDNYNRLQALKRTCIICNSIKDEMNFIALRTHQTCLVCWTCIKKNYVYEKGLKNHCIHCKEIYDDSSELALRLSFEDEVSDEDKQKFYLEFCDYCQEEKDSRKFEKICIDDHKVCRECLQIQKNFGICFCGLDITYLY